MHALVATRAKSLHRFANGISERPAEWPQSDDGRARQLGAQCAQKTEVTGSQRFIRLTPALVVLAEVDDDHRRFIRTIPRRFVVEMVEVFEAKTLDILPGFVRQTTETARECDAAKRDLRVISAQCLGGLPGVVGNRNSVRPAERRDGIADELDDRTRRGRKRFRAYIELQTLQKQFGVLARRAEEQRMRSRR